MKKKFVLTLALVLMVAVTLTAAPIELGGEFTASRTFTFDPTTVAVASSLELNGLSVSGDFWKLSFSDAPLNFGYVGNNAAAEIYLDKALAAQGVDMGDITLTLGVGDKGSSDLMHVYYDDPSKIVGMVGIAQGTTDLTVGYTDMVTAKAAVSFDTTNNPVALSATFAPLDGVKAAAGFTNYAGATETKGAMAVSASVDVAALAGIEDIGLSAYVYDGFYFDSSNNYLDVAVQASYTDIDVTVAMNTNTATDKTGMFVEGSYGGIENVGLSAKLSLADLTGTIATTIEAGGNYSMGGVKYALDAKYVVDGAFSLTPSVTIGF
ncbi:MAG: hypothetical protein WBI82_08195 [Sphaerochaeta sp.]